MPLGVDSSAYEQLEMERGVCNLQRAYTPELIQRKALESPAALLAIVSRTTEIATRLGTFYGSLVLDSLNGTSEQPERIRLRAAQLRYAQPCHCMVCRRTSTHRDDTNSARFTRRVSLPQRDAHCPWTLVHQGWPGCA